jgi:hypothetical protein
MEEYEEEIARSKDSEYDFEIISRKEELRLETED